MIDNFRQVNRLLVKLEENLPIVASMTPQLAATIRQQSQARRTFRGNAPSRRCTTSATRAASSASSIFRAATDGATCLASITHLEFDPRQPFADDVAAYQKHRIERLRAA